MRALLAAVQLGAALRAVAAELGIGGPRPRAEPGVGAGARSRRREGAAPAAWGPRERASHRVRSPCTQVVCTCDRYPWGEIAPLIAGQKNGSIKKKRSN